MKSAIEAKLDDVMQGWSDLDGVAVFCRGFSVYPPRDWYPLVEIFVSGERQVSRGTGDFVYNEYQGIIQVSVRVPDKPQRTGRTVVVSSYTETQTLVRAVRAALGQPSLADLEGLARADGKEVVTQFEIADDSNIDYGIESRDRRRDSLNNFGVVPFRVETREDRSV